MVPTAGPDPCTDPAGSMLDAGADAGAGAYGWQNATILGGGFVSGIEFSPVAQDVIYARTDVGGAYRWDATRWTPITDWVGADNANLMGIESIAPDPVDPMGVYIAAGEYTSVGGVVLHSSDGGKTWDAQNPIAAPMGVQVPMGGNADGRDAGERLAVDPNSQSTLYFAARNTEMTAGAGASGLWVSRDSAHTWTRVAAFPAIGPPTYGLSFVFFDKSSGSPGNGSSKIYVGVAPGAVPPKDGGKESGPGLYLSTDAGMTWAEVPGEPSPSTSQYPHRAALDGRAVMDGGGAIYFTYDDYTGPNSVMSGAVWKLDTTGAWTDVTPSRGKGGFGGVSVDASGAVVVTTLDRWSPDEIYRSTDGGKNWTAIGSPMVAAHDVNGAQWLSFGGGTVNPTGWMGDIKIDPFNPARGLYNTGQGIWWSEDVTSSSVHWKFQDNGLEETVALGILSPSGGTAHLLSAVGDLGGFWHSDLGKSPLGGMFSTPVFGNTTSIDFAEQHPGLVVRVGTNSSNGATQKHGAVSITGGQTWVPFAAEPNGCASSGSIAVSADGATIVWAPPRFGSCSSNSSSVRSDAAPPSSTPAYSRDLGSTWTSCGVLPAGASVVADRVNPMKFYAVSRSQLYASVDDGATFASIGAPLPQGSTVRPLMPYAGGSAEGDLWIPAQGGLYHTTDGGHTLSQISGVKSAAAVGFGLGATCASYPVIYVAGHVNGVSGIYRSDDAGGTFTRIDDPQHQFGTISYVAGDPRVYGRVYLGSGGRGILYGDPQ